MFCPIDTIYTFSSFFSRSSLLSVLGEMMPGLENHQDPLHHFDDMPIAVQDATFQRKICGFIFNFSNMLPGLLYQSRMDSHMLQEER